jgi:hypothetical protein
MRRTATASLCSIIGLVLSTGSASALSADPATPSSTSAASGKPPAIEHTPLTCVKVREHPLVKAGITASSEIERSRVYFKAHQHPDWYYINMQAGEAPSYLALLPQPLPETKAIDYYVYSLDKVLASSRTADFTPEVTQGACRPDGAPPRGFDRRITIGATKEGQSPIPPGFARAGIIAFVTLGGERIIGSALSPGASGAASSKLLIGAGVVAAGGAAVLVATQLGGDDKVDVTGHWVAQPYRAISRYTAVSGGQCTRSVGTECAEEVTFEMDLTQNATTVAGTGYYRPYCYKCPQTNNCSTFSFPLTGSVADGIVRISGPGYAQFLCSDTITGTLEGDMLDLTPTSESKTITIPSTACAETRVATCSGPIRFARSR